MILAIGDKEVRDVEHVRWAYALIKRDLESKINLTGANMAEQEKNLAGEIVSKVMHKLSTEKGLTIGTLSNKMRNINKQNIQKALDYLVDKKLVRSEPSDNKRGTKTEMYYLN